MTLANILSQYPSYSWNLTEVGELAMFQTKEIIRDSEHTAPGYDRRGGLSPRRVCYTRNEKSLVAAALFRGA